MDHISLPVIEDYEGDLIKLRAFLDRYSAAIKVVTDMKKKP